VGYHYKYKEYVYRHMYPKKSSALFTYHRHPDGRGGFLDDGTCELCGTRGKTVLIENEKPRCCYKCYLKLRGSKTEPFGAIGLQNAKYISLEEAKRIVRNADVLKQKKKAGLAIALGLLLLGDKE
jgi:hypothetical protein